MKVILRDDVEKLGLAGEAVNVKSGYARNFLVPRKLAFVATAGALRDKLLILLGRAGRLGEIS